MVNDAPDADTVKELKHLNDLAGAGHGFSLEFNNLDKDMKSRLIGEARNPENSAYVTNLMIVYDERDNGWLYHDMQQHIKLSNPHLESKKPETYSYDRDFTQHIPPAFKDLIAASPSSLAKTEKQAAQEQATPPPKPIG